MKKFLLAMLLMMAASTVSAANNAIASDSITISYEELDKRINDAVNSAIDTKIAENGNKSVAVEMMSSFEDIIIPIFGIVTPFAMVCIVVGLVVNNETKRRRMKYNMVEKAIEHGQQLPEYVFYSQPKGKRKDNALTTSIVLISVGLATSLFFVITRDFEIAALTSMVWMIGAGKLAVYVLDARKKKHQDADQI